MVYTVVDQMPVFPGGDQEMFLFLARTINYPSQAIKEGTSGVVYVTFVVEKDGLLKDVRVLRGVHPALDAEAVRAVSAMPKWEAGIHQGDVCCVQYNLPIRFTLRTREGEKGSKNAGKKR
jgi:periplasmic protein TonB